MLSSSPTWSSNPASAAEFRGRGEGGREEERDYGTKTTNCFVQGGQMDPLFVNLRCLITFSRLFRCCIFTLPDSNIRVLLPFFTGMKTSFFFILWNFPFDIGHCKYENIAVLNLYLDIKGGVV